MDYVTYCNECCKMFNYTLVEYTAPVLDSYCRPISPSTYRVVDEKGNIITYGTIETIYAYFTMKKEMF